MMESCLTHVGALLVPSRFAMEQHRAAGVDRPMYLHPHFVDSFVDANAPSSTRADEPFFLYVGRLEKLKGVQDLIELFRGYREAKLRIVGAGTYESELRRQSSGLDHVEFLGARHPSAISRLYREAIAVLVPSLCYETFGLTAAEALAQATPIIVRRIGALSEIIEQSSAGYSFETMEECRDAMERLKNDADHRDWLGRRGRATAARLWSVEVHLKRYLEIVEELKLGRERAGHDSAEGPCLDTF